MSRKLRSSLVILSILVAALAMWLWLRSFNVSTDEVAQLFARVQWWLLLPLFVLLVGHVALSAWRWSLIEVGLGGQLPRFGPAFVTGAFAQGLGTMLPSPIVNVICRGLANRLNGASGLRGAFSGGIDQIADLVIVLLLVIPAAFAFIHRNFWLYLWGGGTMLLIGLALIAYLPNLTRSLSLPFRIPGIHLALPLVHRPTLFKIYGISLLRITNLTLMNIVIYFAVGSSSVPAILVAVPLVTLATSVSMLPGAIGISEWSFSVVFVGFGITRGATVLFVLANRILLTGLSLVLAVCVLLAMSPRWIRTSPTR